MMNNDMIKNMIMTRQGASEAIAERAMEKIAVLQPQLKGLLEAWIENPEVRDDTLYAGYSLNILMDDYWMDFTGALFTLDWLIREPQTAAAALEKGFV